MKLFARRRGRPSELRRFDRAIAAVVDDFDEGYPWEFTPGGSPAAQQLLDLDRAEQPDAIIALLWAGARRADRFSGGHQALDAVASQMLRRKLPWTDESLCAALDALDAHRARDGRLDAWTAPVGALVGAIEKSDAADPPSDDLRTRLEGVREALMIHSSADDLKAARRIAELLGDARDKPALGDDRWAQAVGGAIAEHDDELAAAAVTLAAGASSARMPAKFENGARELVDQHGAQAVDALVGDALSAAAAVRDDDGKGQVPPDTGDLLRGLAWIASVSGGERALRAAADLAVAGWRKVPYHGPMCAKAANACVAVLARVPEGAPHLGRVRVFVKQPQAVEKIDEAIGDAAEQLGIPRDQFVERVVPDMGLTGGARSVTLGDHEGVLRVHPDGTARLAFRNADGKELKTVPKAVREDFPGELADLRREVKDLKAMAGAQRARVERLLIDEREWSWDDWRRYYGDHGLIAPLVERVIWQVDAGGDGDWRPWIDAADERPPAGESARVRLWHPAAATAAEVRRWRERLESDEIKQPFKQAHREIYVLTDAERETANYSNRFAGHIIKQHQFNALCGVRGWRYTLQGAWDSPDVEAVLDLPQHGLQVAFWVERPWDAVDWDDMVVESGVFAVVATDQVRFLDRETLDPVELERVPPRVFSEAMRDVDLFVGVCSIGNDPTWYDQAEARPHAAPYQEYWHSYAFGDLGGQAETRREVLERLLPKLALRDVAEVGERFLRVEGKRRTYKIHLGSGNILMEPNDQYLCIVEGRERAADKVFLPFEGDRGLAVILSKAFLLAADEEIKDRTINMQIGRR